MPYQSINGKIYENEHDEELSRRFGDKYGYIKYKYPEAYKLSEREIRDSQKDLNNNDESLNWGLNNPNASVRKWLRGLDINTNTWKKQNE